MQPGSKIDNYIPTAFQDESPDFSDPFESFTSNIPLFPMETITKSNFTLNDSSSWEGVPYNRTSRLISLVILFVLTVFGNLMVVVKIVSNWKNRRVDFIYISLASADLCVALMTLLSQIIWECLQDVWLAGDFACRIVKVAQIFGLMASSNMIVVVALERQHVVVNPLQLPLPIRKLSFIAWASALLLSMPQAVVFRVIQTSSTRQCLSIFSDLPKWHFQIYIIYGAMTVFFIPFCVLCFAYTRILWTVWSKEKGLRENPLKLGKAAAKSGGDFSFTLNPANSYLPKAKIKTLKMTLVIILCFILCGLPYFVVEMKFAFGNFTKLDEEVTAVLGIFVVSNSAVNPFVYLFFNSRYRFLQRLESDVCFVCFREAKSACGRSSFVSSSRTDRFSVSSEMGVQVQNINVSVNNTLLCESEL
ncbi:probable G-protein coupled receptor 150 [Protopterus annectens]|uniref:probable G-protein coupled receptor 150 n=1 Tax=Protopterus annectens TaxID=7888 RepID=UPI001CFC1EB6|nr:probable G-protein coupled receptor 150 [Protopterus annectens]